MNNNFLKYKDYLAKIEYDADEKLLYGTIQGISDLIIFEASSVSEIEKEFQDAVEDYIETCKELGKSHEKAYKGSFNVRIDPEQHRKIARLAFRENITLNKLVADAIQEKILRMENKEHNLEDVKNKVAEINEKLDYISAATIKPVNASYTPIPRKSNLINSNDFKVAFAQ